MKTLRINRRKGNDPQLGKFSDWSVDGTDFTCVGVERPWVDEDRNGVRDPNISCIKPGEYDLKWTKSNRLGVYTYEVMSVEGASGIRIHSANWARQLQGCLAPGRTIEPVEDQHTGVRTLGVTMSGITLKKLEDTLERKTAKLIIADEYQKYGKG